jgi:hypothetical protein
MQITDEIWLAGKGPSLDTFDWSKAGKYRVGINEAAYFVPDCWGAIALDERVLDKYMGKCVPSRHLTYDHEPLPPHIIVFKKPSAARYNFPNDYTWQKHVQVQTCYSTATVAIELFHSFGVKKINFIGFDSWDGVGNYSDKIIEFKGRGSNSDCFKGINQQIAKVLKETGVEATWHHQLK